MLKINSNTTTGQLIREALKERGLTQRSFAGDVGLSASHLSEILNGKRSITNNLVEKISDLLGIPECILIELQARKVYDKAMEKAIPPQEQEAKDILDAFDKVVCVSSLLKGSNIKKKAFSDKLQWLESHYGLSSPKSLQTRAEGILNGCFRRSSKTGLDSRMIMTWAVKAATEARNYTPNNEYKPKCTQFLKDDLCAILHRNNNDTLTEIFDCLQLYGIGFACVEREQGASIDGFSFLENGIPYIVITKRFNRIDNLAFTLMHEIGHIVLGHLKEGEAKINIVTGDNGEEDELPEEREANEFASEALIPASKWNYAPSVPLWPAAIQKKYTAWAERNGLNKWIVLGRVSHETGMYRFTSDKTREICGSVPPQWQKGGSVMK